jgi:hypothetical protein
MEQTQRFHKPSDVSSGYFEPLQITSFITRNEQVIDNDERDNKVVKYDYVVFKKGDYLALGKYITYIDNSLHETDVQETIFPFNKDGCLQKVVKRTYYSWDDGYPNRTKRRDHPSFVDPQVMASLKIEFEKLGVNYDSAQMKVISW